jgi:hypothetical protein
MRKSRILIRRLRPNIIYHSRVRMSSFTLPDYESVTVTLPENGVIQKDDLLDFRPFQVHLHSYS